MQPFGRGWGEVSGQEGTPNGVDRLARLREMLVGALNDALPSPDWSWEILHAWDAMCDERQRLRADLERIHDLWMDADGKLASAEALSERLNAAVDHLTAEKMHEREQRFAAEAWEKRLRADRDGWRRFALRQQKLHEEKRDALRRRDEERGAT
jgi:hypothetical protein